MSKKSILYGNEARDAVFQGAKKIRDIVATTLGPKGHTVLIGQEYGDPKVTKDGVTVAKAVELDDEFEDLGAKTMRSVALKMSEGDGTTSSIVFSYALLEEARKYIVAGHDTNMLIKEIEETIHDVIEILHKHSKPIKGNVDLIRQVATISANGDHELGDMIAKAFNKIGDNGVITVEESKTGNTQWEVVDGMKIDKGFVTPHFITNAEKGIAELADKVFILVYQDKISNFFALVKLLEQVARNSGSLWILADDVDGDALNGLILNKLQNKIKVCCTKAPGFGDNKNGILEDVAQIVGTRVMSAQLGDDLERIQLSELGMADRIITSKDSTIISGGHGDKEEIKNHAKNLYEMAKKTESEYDKKNLVERAARMTNGIGVIRIGGYSSMSIGEMRDRADDAVHAVQAAIEGGILPGGGSSFLYAGTCVKKDTLGARIVIQALKSITETIAENAGLRSSGTVIDKILENGKGSIEYGYDAKRGEFGSMYTFGVIDATKIACAVLNKGFDGVKTLISTHGVIAILKDKDGKAASDMNGMY